MTSLNQPPRARSPLVLKRRAEPRTTVVFDTLWRLATERQAIFFKRIAGRPRPWTDDPILSGFKFTNAYRAADKTTQYLIRRVIYGGDPGPSEVFFRTILFKLFNRIETWQLLVSSLGEPTVARFDPEQYSAVLEAARARGLSIYSAAYIMPPPQAPAPTAKHRGHLALLAGMLATGQADEIMRSRSLADVYRLLLGNPSFGKFLAYQLAIDLNYGPDLAFDEADFVVAGPGAHEGIEKCFSSRDDWTDEDLIYWTVERQEREFDRLGLRFEDLWGRPLQPVDCQNLYCETAKYARVAHPDFTRPGGRSRIKQHFRAGASIGDPWFPPHWGLNEQVAEGLARSRPADVHGDVVGSIGGEASVRVGDFVRDPASDERLLCGTA